MNASQATSKSPAPLAGLGAPSRSQRAPSGAAASHQDSTSPGAWRRLLAAVLNDPRDHVFVELGLAMTLLQIPFALALFVLGQFSWWLAAGYWAIWGVLFFDRYILMLHCVSHRPLFNKQWRVLNSYIPVVLAVFYGQTPHTYFGHHLGMHHKENNEGADLSTTMPYQRDSFLAWLHYYASFMFLGLARLVVYLHRKNRTRLARRVLWGELGFWAAVSLLGWFVSWQATLVVFVLPVLVVRTLMMMGNWTQHAFVDAADPGNPFRNSITSINTRYNRRCFNDGYHIVHHFRPALHYTEMPLEFEQRKQEYGKADAVVFDGLDYFQIWLLLMLGQWRPLARAFVRLPGAPDRSDEEAIAFLKSRLRPIPIA